MGFKKGNIPWNLGRKFLAGDLNPSKRPEVRKKISEAKKGCIPWCTGLTKETDERIKKLGESISKARKELKQKGLLTSWNKGLTKETSEKIKEMSEKESKIILNQFKNGRKTCPKPYKLFKAGFREDLGHYVRSSWEANYARILKYLKIEYFYEFKRFDLGKTTYTPDFYLPNSDEYHEIKGSLYNNKEKINLFKEKYPKIKFILIDTKKYKKLKAQYQPLISGWEDYEW